MHMESDWKREIIFKRFFAKVILENMVGGKSDSGATPVVVLLSGGLDSSTVLAVAKSEGFAPYAMTFRYGQRHQLEIE
ncbi:MAG: 7-cyano-7-deazaguanine synthase, partial [Acidobacteriaceae bacterium]|nr:7-cyano-7-deazaguanine synthase [Acidobacteriaceae bacterium]